MLDFSANKNMFKGVAQKNMLLDSIFYCHAQNGSNYNNVNIFKLSYDNDTIKKVDLYTAWGANKGDKDTTQYDLIGFPRVKEIQIHQNNIIIEHDRTYKVSYETNELCISLNLYNGYIDRRNGPISITVEWCSTLLEASKILLCFYSSENYIPRARRLIPLTSWIIQSESFHSLGVC